MNKKYYWLKLKKDFFKDRKMKKLRKIAGGPIYTIIYLKLQLLCLDNGGIIEFEGVEDNLIDELALEIDETPENVGVTLSLLKKWRLVEMKEDDIFLPEVLENTGNEAASTTRSRKSRAKKKLETEKAKMLQCNIFATNCNTEKELNLDLKKEKENPYGKLGKLSTEDINEITSYFIKSLMKLLPVSMYISQNFDNSSEFCEQVLIPLTKLNGYQRTLNALKNFKTTCKNTEIDDLKGLIISNMK